MLKKITSKLKQNKNKVIYLIFTMSFILLFFLAILIFSLKKAQITISKVINTKDLNKDEDVYINVIGEENINEAREVLNLKEYENMPRNIDKYKVIGKITIPKINVEKYILEETTKDSLLQSVTKICGPDVNKTGNLCLAGHNYADTFGYISSLDIKDKIQITDTYNRTVTYEVYDIYKVSPYDTKCLSQETNSEREITLVTCTLGAIKRIVVKAIEVYD